MEALVSGIGCLCAAGRKVAEIWPNLTGGLNSSPSPPEKLLQLARKLNLGELTHPAFTVPNDCFPDGIRHTSRDTLALAESAAREALAMSGLEIGQLSDDRSAVIVGSTVGNALHFLEDYAAFKQGLASSWAGFHDYFNCNPAVALAQILKIGGPSLTVGNACCSGSDAVGLGLEMIASGRCERVLAGGADALSLVPYIGFRRLMIYSDQACRPFDRDRRGLNLGEGAGFLVIESARALEKRKGRALAKLLGYAAAADAHHLTAPHPEATGIRKAIRSALRRSGLTPDSLAFVSVHGTATAENDRVEALALRSEAPDASVWALKGSTGHTLGAAGAVEAALSVAALDYGLLPRSYGFVTFDPALGLRPTELSQPITKSAAMSISLGFGGGNSALVFGSVK
ncbi:MAG: beta-ketoacyl-[acyl-carrier-protein] synthase family protein [Deltaproteobacteria bacterium]|jgi:3-oxoacyl-[acyl-carrier-protein] synthase-1/3-oxoacyl-[acyl-carrier-protein] synthase II|nr:beta-ketoacyl-[acyl-carrier-protein] synthase family protein [Deltaproteobacteria bacterium]